MPTIPRVLSIAGTDPTGGAGIQADLKSIGALGGYGMAVVTALVAQNTRGVRSLHVPDPAFLREQLESVSDDVEIDAVKLGMLHSAPVIETVADWLEHAAPRLVVLDPVMVATSGDRLLDAAAVTALRSLCRRVQLVTPNLPELAILVDETEAADWGEALVQARRLAREARVTILLKGGHLHGSACPDAIVTENTTTEIPGTRISSSNTHGTGCSLSAAMATLAAGGLSWVDALRRAKAWLAGAIANGSSLDVGGGNGPIDHFHELRPYLDSPRDARQGADPATADPVPAPAEHSWTSDRWAANAGVQRAIEECDFVRGLADGTLPRDAFLGYLEQDALYLRDYARVLASAAVLAPTSAEQEFWASGAQGAIAEETNLHRTRVGDTDAGPRAVTTAYLDHLLAASARGEYAVIAAAVLPCYRVYTELGSVFGRDIAASHPYGDWLTTYADPAFRIATERAIAITDRAAREASPAVRERMARAFDAAMRHELAFFCDPLNVPVAV